MTHLIATARYTPDGSFVVCDCGETYRRATPERVAEAFADHRRANGLRSWVTANRSTEVYRFRITRSEATA